MFEDIYKINLIYNQTFYRQLHCIFTRFSCVLNVLVYHKTVGTLLPVKVRQQISSLELMDINKKSLPLTFTRAYFSFLYP